MCVSPINIHTRSTVFFFVQFSALHCTAFMHCKYITLKVYCSQRRSGHNQRKLKTFVAFFSLFLSFLIRVSLNAIAVCATHAIAYVSSEKRGLQTYTSFGNGVKKSKHTKNTQISTTNDRLLAYYFAQQRVPQNTWRSKCENCKLLCAIFLLVCLPYCIVQK